VEAQRSIAYDDASWLRRVTSKNHYIGSLLLNLSQLTNEDIALRTTVKIKLIVSSAFLALSLSSGAADIEAGKAKAAMCASCHGAAGISAMDIWPSLAGQKTGYLAKQLKAFRDGSRSDPVMNAQAKGLSDADIDNLSAFYNSLK
jgi:cytochrome c553|tara:strand:+ start:286 stop:720 length:435 start_codon:yes stop_codon:yes gene_type:complete